MGWGVGCGVWGVGCGVWGVSRCQSLGVDLLVCAGRQTLPGSVEVTLGIATDTKVGSVSIVGTFGPECLISPQDYGYCSYVPSAPRPIPHPPFRLDPPAPGPPGT
jgi:hypothetical protein